MSIDHARVTARFPTLKDVFASPTIRSYSTAVAIVVAGIGIGGILFFLLLPTLIVLPMSLSETHYIEFPPQGLTFKWYSAYFDDPDWMAATWFSLKIAMATTATATVAGTMAAIAIVRGSLPFRSTLQALTLGPMIVPHIILGVALYLAFSPLQLTGSFFGFLVAHTVLAVPYVIITVTASLQRFDPTLELAALSCGANRLQAFFLVVLPNIVPGVAAAAVFAFLASFDEATVAFFISDIGGKSLGRKMFEDIDFNLTPVIAAVSTVLIATSLLLMGAVHLMNARKSRSY
ncbi:ABC transporter permease [Sinorhizobium americanum]|uniref:Mannopine transport system permease protein n=1 Tax=Sinorhizobium americanum TaxID=194963 RepID=A0A4V2RFP0_9HYPH|nr:ABC transporter permease [Sinorhizobium americanum]TCN33340.1 mannopine transport system permease protein [Sinorhizobium americanum]